MHEIEIRDLPQQVIAAVPHRGAYAGIGAAFDLYMRRIVDAGLAGQTGEGVAIYHDSPARTAEADLRSHAGGIVAPDLILPQGLERVVIAAGRHAVLTLRGPYSGIAAGWRRIHDDWLPTSGETPSVAPPFEVYVSDPRTTRPADLVTLICVPLA